MSAEKSKSDASLKKMRIQKLRRESLLREQESLRLREEARKSIGMKESSRLSLCIQVETACWPTRKDKRLYKKYTLTLSKQQ